MESKVIKLISRLSTFDFRLNTMKDLNKIKQEKKRQRHGRVRSRVTGSADVPRLNVFKGNQSIFLQIIDDAKGVTLVSVKDTELKDKKTKGKVDKAKEAGKLLAEKAGKAGIEKVVFDRGGYKYHGRVKAVAEGAREGGLEF